MNIAFWLIIIFIMIAVWYLCTQIAVPFIHILLKKLEKEIEDEKEIAV